MPIRHIIVHQIDKKPDGTPAVLHARDTELGSSQAIENMLADLNESYNAKQGNRSADLAGKAIQGILFAGEINDLAHTYDFTSHVVRITKAINQPQSHRLLARPYHPP